MKLKLLIIIALQLFVGVNLVNSSGACPSSEAPPEITEPPPNYVPDTHEIEEEEFTLICRAAFPIEWSFDGDLSKDYISVTRTRNFTVFHSVSSNAGIYSSCYESVILTQRWYPSFSGSFTCMGRNDPSKSASLHKFYTGSDSKLFNFWRTSGLTYKINLLKKTKDNQYVIPCQANYPKVNASLIKINHDGEEIPLEIGPDVKYVPELGFLLKDNPPTDPAGKYKCTGTYGISKYKEHYVDEAEIDVKVTDVTASFEPVTDVVSFKNGTMTLICESVNEVQFDTSAAPDVKILSQMTKKHTQLHLVHMGRIVLRSTGSSKGQVSCRSKDTNQVIKTWKFDETDKCTCLWKTWKSGSTRIDDPYGVFVCAVGHKSKTQDDLLTCANPSECNLFLQCPDEDNCRIKQQAYFANFGAFTPELSYGILKCTAEEFTTTKMAPADKKKFEYKFDNYQLSSHSEDIISIKAAKTVIQVGDTQSFTCKIYKNFLVEEIRWGMKLRNGSMIYINQVSGASPITYSTYELESINNIEIFDKTIEYVYCFATSWETGEIRNASVKIVTREPYIKVDDPRKYGCTNLQDAPTIYLGLTSQTDAKAVTWYKATGSDIIVDNYENVHFICLSKFLSQWGRGDPSESFYRTSNKEILRTAGRRNPCFLNSLEFQSYYSDIGNLTCSPVSPGAGKLNSSIYLYVRDDDSHLLDHGRHESVTLDKSEEWTTLPCKVNDPSAPVHLIRQDYSGKLETIKESKANVKYDPKRGYLVKTVLFFTIWNISDTLICSSTVKGKEDVETNHVVTFSIEQTSADKSDELKESGEHGSYDLASVLIPWLLVVILLAFVICFGIYTRNLRKSPSPTIYMSDVRKQPSSSIGTTSAAVQGAPNSIHTLDENGGVTNLGYEKFN